MTSAALGRTMPILVYVPRGYDSGNTSYPVVYLLHGYGGGHGEWQYYGVFEEATKLIDSGDIPPMIIVLPEGELGYWFDHADNGPKYGTYLSHDVVSYVDTTYRTQPTRARRAIGGLSMGADGALDAAFHDPEEFSIIGAHSPVLRTKSEAYSFYGDQQYFEDHDPLSIVKNHADALRAAQFTIWVDEGTNDEWLSHTHALIDAFTAANVPITWHEFDGDHSGAYWKEHLDEYLRFYGDAFRASVP